MSDKPAVIGGGLAGALAATYLAHRGQRVALYERRPDIRSHELPAGRSINLALARRGIAALEQAGVYDAVKDLALPMRGRMIHDRAGETSLQPYSQNPDEVIYSISRTELNRRLLDAAEAAGVDLYFDHCCTGIDCDSGTLQFEHEPESRVFDRAHQPIIAADGAGSVVRRALMKTTGAETSEDILDHDYKELTIAPGPGGTHRMDPAALHIWPRGGYMLIALPNLDGSFTVTLFLAKDGEPSFATLTDAAAVEHFFAEQFPDAAALMPDLAELFFDNPTGMLGTVWCPRWHYDGRVLLLGDAAHAIVPFHGQGMNCAFEDCLLLDRMLEARGGDFSSAFAAFAQARKPNTDALAEMALENYVEMRDAVRDEGFKLRKEIGWMLESRHPDRFVPRYSMVMFRTLPYAEAFERGRIQQELLMQLSKGIDAPDQVDMELADRMVMERLEAIASRPSPPDRVRGRLQPSPGGRGN
ncbi:MAG TPA: NAD(P)/FAD-dependent oxidoreductase [Gammaproteobacteria bacterium]|nr:NAD(P)/FAD-dependent oxidoreductase [Gammaproteobacteria bacterium]